ncbi:VTC4 [Symbiodinium pilosum]|uniref:VTC4 protein n=1 Tax=Symbiodinium pilosum TaxID=2952 RepID=A0A812WTE8_SYMPI|nr:VTC4 [Symbiodinium pilosum]
MNSPLSSSATVELRKTDVAIEIPEFQLDLQRKGNISRLKEFYLRRLSQSETAAVSRLRAKSATFSSPRWSPRTSANDIEWDIASNKGFSKASETGSSDFQLSPTSDLRECTKAVPQKSMVELDAKLGTVMAALESRILNCLEPNAMRHLKQLRHHLETALRWTSPDLTLLGEQTAQQVKQLNGTARVLAPGVYVFSKRAEHLIIQKERFLKKMAKKLAGNGACGGSRTYYSADMPDWRLPASQYRTESTVVSEMDSDYGTGTVYADTVITWDGPDVGNIQEANDYLASKNEDEQRRWFYSQCLAAKMSAADQDKARKVLISDLYLKVKAAALPVGSWATFINGELAPATA